jgi:heme-degrading monooxygenase HmoA
MFARKVSVHLKPNCVTEFTRTLDREIIPLLRKQKGFQDEVTLVTSNGTEAVAISFWEHNEDAEAYNRGSYPQALKALTNVVEGTPQVQTYEVANSTFHKIVGRAATA